MINIQKQSWKEIFDKDYTELSYFGPNEFIQITGDYEEVIKFISQEIQKAYQKGIVDAVKELDELGYNKEAVQKAREETLKEVLPEENKDYQESIEAGVCFSSRGFNKCRQEIINKAKNNWGIIL